MIDVYYMAVTYRSDRFATTLESGRLYQNIERKGRGKLNIELVIFSCPAYCINDLGATKNFLKMQDRNCIHLKEEGWLNLLGTSYVKVNLLTSSHDSHKI